MNSVYSLHQFKAVLFGLGYFPTRIEARDATFWPGTTQSNEQLDPDTQVAIQAFQTFYHLAPTGEPDGSTQERARQLVRNLQHSLNLVIQAQLPLSEYYGDRTTHAVQRFQQQQGLPVTGIATVEVRRLLAVAVKQHLRQQMEELAGSPVPLYSN